MTSNSRVRLHEVGGRYFKDVGRTGARQERDFSLCIALGLDNIIVSMRAQNARSAGSRPNTSKTISANKPM